MNPVNEIIAFSFLVSLDAATLVRVLAHTLWQAPLWGFVLWLSLRVTDPRYVTRRYAFTLIALAGVVLSPLVTWSVLRVDGSPAVADSRIDVAATETTDAATFGAKSEPPAADEPQLSERGSVERRVDETTAESGPDALPGVHQSNDSLDDPAGESSLDAASALAMLWLLGASVMLIRQLRSVLAARALADGEVVSDPALLEMLRRVQHAMSIRNPLRVVGSERVSTPMIVGVVRPTLVLPLSLMTGLAPAEFQAILAHELAHVRRYDALVNLFQLLIEALLFFNPAVWWISRQVRREREACCDATAAAVSPSPWSYAEVLVRWVERAQPAGKRNAGHAIAAVTFDAEPGSLRDRIERLVTPGYRPRQRMPLKTCLVVSLLALAGLIALQRGTDLAVAVAGQLLSDEERVKHLVETGKAVGAATTKAAGTYTLEGTVRTVDGQPLEGASVTLVTRSPNTNRIVGQNFRGNEFEYEVHTGRTRIGIRADGYAPAVRGPISGDADSTVTLEEIELQKGFDAAVRIVDEDGESIDRAKLRMTMVVEGQGIVSVPQITVQGGTTKLEHLSEHPYQIYVDAEGYQRLTTKPKTFEPGGELELVMEAARPTSGIVLSDEGEPAEGIEIWQSREVRPGTTNATKRKLAVTDAAGRFSLTELRDTASYTLFLKDGDRVAGVIDEVLAGESGLQWQLLPSLVVRGRVIGLDSADADTTDDSANILYYTNYVGENEARRVAPYPNSRRQATVDERGEFVIEDLSAGKIDFQAGSRRTIRSRRASFELSESRDDLVVDFTTPEPELPKREVVITFRGPDGPAPIRGSAQLFTTPENRDRPRGRGSEKLDVELDGPTVRVEAFAPGRISGNGEDAVGFWFDHPRIDVPAGEEPLETTIDVLPAGAITGRILRDDGTPATGPQINVGCRMRHSPEPEKSRTESLGNTRVDEQGEFFLSPVILGAEVVVSVHEGHNVQVGEPLELTAENPTGEVTLQFSSTVDVSGVVLDEHDDPVSRLPIKLRFEHRHKTISFGQDSVTDRDGTFEIEGISASVGEYFMEIDSRRDFVPVRQPLRRDGQPMEIRLREGRAITGIVIDQAERPVPGVEVYARPVEWQPGERYAYEAEATSDADGRFRLSNLPDQVMELNARQMWNLEQQEVHPGRPDVAPHVTLKGQIADWHREKLAGERE